MIKYIKEGFCYPDKEEEMDMVYCDNCINKCQEYKNKGEKMIAECYKCENELNLDMELYYGLCWGCLDKIWNPKNTEKVKG